MYSCAVMVIDMHVVPILISWTNSYHLIFRIVNTLKSHDLNYSPIPNMRLKGVHFTFTCPLTAGVFWAPQVTSQPVSSTFLCSPLPSGTWRTPGSSISYLSSHLFSCLPRLLSPLCLTRWFWPDLMNRRRIHTTSVCVSLQWSGGLCVVWMATRSCHRFPRW